MSLLHFSKWKIFGILAAVLIGVVFAIPNALPEAQRKSLPSFAQNTINLGLDLQGGAHLLLEVDAESVLNNEKRLQKENMRAALRDAGLRASKYDERGNQLIARFEPGTDIAAAQRALDGIVDNIGTQIGAGKNVSVENSGNNSITVTITDENIDSIKDRTIAQSIEVLRRRVDPNGTTEMTLAKEGEDRILMQIPGAKDIEQVKSVINKSANLSFHMVNDDTDNAAILEIAIRTGHIQNFKLN